MSSVRYAFFGSPEIAVHVLDELLAAGFPPALVVTKPDKPAGRGHVLTPPPVKEWADTHAVPVLQPKRLDEEFLATVRANTWDVFIVAAYGKILPQTLLDIPRRGTLNMHPSLLPRLRGPSPIQSAVLFDEKKTGVSVMLLDADMDHGPVLAQKEVPVEWPPYASEMEEPLAREGGKLLAEVLPAWVEGTITAREQDHQRATYCTMFTKEDALIDLVSGDPYATLLKIRAFDHWPIAYTYFERRGERIRVQILRARFEGGVLIPEVVKPEGKRTMPYEDFLRSGAVPANIATGAQE